MSVLSFDEVAWLRDNSPARLLLRADDAPLVLSFLHQVFVAENVRSIPAAALASRLDDELYALNQRDGEAKKFPKPAKAYLDDLAARRRHPPGARTHQLRRHRACPGMSLTCTPAECPIRLVTMGHGRHRPTGAGAGRPGAARRG